MLTKSCPFHRDSRVRLRNGDIHEVHCPHCGDYRITDVAMDRLRALRRVPRDWPRMVAHNHLISYREVRRLA